MAGAAETVSLAAKHVADAAGPLVGITIDHRSQDQPLAQEDQEPWREDPREEVRGETPEQKQEMQEEKPELPLAPERMSLSQF